MGNFNLSGHLGFGGGLQPTVCHSSCFIHV